MVDIKRDDRLCISYNSSGLFPVSFIFRHFVATDSYTKPRCCIGPIVGKVLVSLPRNGHVVRNMCLHGLHWSAIKCSLSAWQAPPQGVRMFQNACYYFDCFCLASPHLSKAPNLNAKQSSHTRWPSFIAVPSWRRHSRKRCWFAQYIMPGGCKWQSDWGSSIFGDEHDENKTNNNREKKCMYVCMNVCMHVCLSVCLHACMHIFHPSIIISQIKHAKISNQLKKRTKHSAQLLWAKQGVRWTGPEDTPSSRRHPGANLGASGWNPGRITLLGASELLMFEYDLHGSWHKPPSQPYSQDHWSLKIIEDHWRSLKIWIVWIHESHTCPLQVFCLFWQLPVTHNNEHHHGGFEQLSL